VCVYIYIYTWSLKMGVPVYSRRLKCPGRSADHPPRSRTETATALEPHLCFPSVSAWACNGVTFTFYMYIYIYIYIYIYANLHAHIRSNCSCLITGMRNRIKTWRRLKYFSLKSRAQFEYDYLTPQSTTDSKWTYGHVSFGACCCRKHQNLFTSTLLCYTEV
jgi:hypothetical protein